jgi:hypothetical protein
MNGKGAGTSEIPELRTAAIAVWHYWRVEGKSGSEAWAATLETKAKQSRRMELFRAELYRVVGERDDIRLKINGGCVEADIEDLRFVALELTASKSQEHQTVVTLLGRCPSCGTETISEPIFSLGGLGKMLESFQPIYVHSCPSRQQSKSDR